MDYAMYKGDELLFVGTLQELADFRDVKKETITHYATPTGHKKAKRNDGKPSKRVIVVRLDETEDEEVEQAGAS